MRNCPATCKLQLHYLYIMEPVIFQDLGTRPYKDVWDYQEQLLQQNVARKTALRALENAAQNCHSTGLPATEHYLLFVEHPPVFTLGKNGNAANVLLSENKLQEKQIEYFHINRGGDITFHGPQQVVGYPIFDLEKFKTDLGWYLRSLEEVIIRTMAAYGLKGERSAGETGVWLDPQVPGRERKICAMGIRCSRWITMHGFAFNVNTDLDYFNYIIPCGIQNKQVTSLEKELGHAVPIEEVKDLLKTNFAAVFGLELK